MTTAPIPTAMTDGTLYRLMSWLSPSYPVGAFSHSHGLEWAVEQGWVKDRASLIAWLEDLLDHGGGWSDAAVLVHGWRAEGAAAVATLIATAIALAPARERQSENLAQGTAFVLVSRSSWPCPRLDWLPAEGPVPYPVAVGVQGAGHGLALGPLVSAYLHGFAANLVSAAQRLVPLGQTDGQQAIAALMPVVERVAARAVALDPEGDLLDHVGGAAFLSDIAAMRHETQYTRLFRT